MLGVSWMSILGSETSWYFVTLVIVRSWWPGGQRYHLVILDMAPHVLLRKLFRTCLEVQTGDSGLTLPEFSALVSDLDWSALLARPCQCLLCCPQLGIHEAQRDKSYVLWQDSWYIKPLPYLSTCSQPFACLLTTFNWKKCWQLKLSLTLSRVIFVLCW